jgi:hypothetical protein
VFGKLSKREEFTVKYQITEVQQSNKLVIVAALALIRMSKAMTFDSKLK